MDIFVNSLGSAKEQKDINIKKKVRIIFIFIFSMHIKAIMKVA